MSELRARYDWDESGPGSESGEQDWDAEVEYKEQCITSLVNAAADCRHFMSFKAMLRIILDHE